MSITEIKHNTVKMCEMLNTLTSFIYEEFNNQKDGYFLTFDSACTELISFTETEFGYILECEIYSYYRKYRLLISTDLKFLLIDETIPDTMIQLTFSSLEALRAYNKQKLTLMLLNLELSEPIEIKHIISDDELEF